MTQTYKKSLESESIEIEEIQQSKAQESIKSEVDNLFGDLNPRYFEEVITLKEANTKIDLGKVYTNLNFNSYGL